MIHHNTEIEGCFELTPKIYSDERGSFSELYKASTLKSIVGYSVDFVQENHSVSSYGVIRGLHYQQGVYAQAKLIRVSEGRILDVVLDLRASSSTYGKVFTVELSAEKNNQLFIPKGCAHGFSVLSESAKVIYLCDEEYHPTSERGIRFDDADLKIDWKIEPAQQIVSDKDLALPNFKSHTND